MVYLVIGSNGPHEYVDAIFQDRGDADKHKELCESLSPHVKYRVDERHLR